MSRYVEKPTRSRPRPWRSASKMALTSNVRPASDPTPSYVIIARLEEATRQPRGRRRHPPQARRGRPPVEDRTPDRRCPARGPARPQGRRAQGRSRPAGRRPRPARQPPVLRRTLLPARPGRRGARRPPPGRPAQRGRSQGPARPGRDPRRPVPDRGSHRDVLAGVRQVARPRSQALGRHPAHRALPPAQPVRPPDRPPRAPGARGRPPARDDHLPGPGVFGLGRLTGPPATELERLLSTNPRDTKLLYQLSMLSESEGDPATAAKFQKQLVDIAPGDEANRQARPALHPERRDRRGRGPLDQALERPASPIRPGS